MSADKAKLSTLAASRGYTLVKGKGQVVGQRDYGKYGLVDAKTCHQRFGFGNRGVTATLEEIERFLNGDRDQAFEASLNAAKKGKRPVPPRSPK